MSKSCVKNTYFLVHICQMKYILIDIYTKDYIHTIYIYIKFGRLKKFKSNKVKSFGMSLKAHGLTALTWLNFLPRWESPSYVKFKLNESTIGQMISPSHH